MISIVVPTYNEAENLLGLVEQVFATLHDHGIEGELIIVDDGSPDGTGDRAEQFARDYPIKLVRRTTKSGLASAVLDGLRHTEGDIIGVMDADLSHDPRAIPALVAAIRDRGADLAVGSRYVSGGGIAKWTLARRFASRAANWIARPFTHVRDATSGFFFFRRDVLDGVSLDPRGFKIGLEIMVKGHVTRWEEVPYSFTDRRRGASKFGVREVRDYLGQLARFARLRLRGRWPSSSWLWPLLAAFTAIQAAVVLFAANGPFVDEGIYAVAGLRVLEGHGLADGYLRWFNGCPFLWPVFAALGHRLAGLAGARLVALLFSVVTLVAFAKSVEALFGRSAAVWGTVAFGANGLFLALAHFAVYDVAALAGLAVSIWFITRWARLGQFRWLAIAAGCFALAVIAKYGYIFMLVPTVALATSVRPPARSWRDIGAFGFVACAVPVAYFSVVFGSPWPTSSGAYFSQSFPATRADIAAQQVFYGVVPLLLAVWGGFAAWRRHRRALVITCLASFLIWPAFHLEAVNRVSAPKHVVAGFLFAYLLAGPGLERLWSSRHHRAMNVVLPLVVMWGMLQWKWQEYSWADSRPAADYLVHHMRPGEAMVAHSSSAYELYLYPLRIVASPSLDVAEPSSPSGQARLDTCTVPWLVGTGGKNDPVEIAATRCGYKLVLSSWRKSYAVGFSTTRPWLFSYRAMIDLYRLPPR